MFTDTQLEQWKLDPNHQGAHSCNGRCALIRRLEAAEKVCAEWAVNANLKHPCSMNDLYKDWRKSCGKGGGDGQ